MGDLKKIWGLSNMPFLGAPQQIFGPLMFRVEHDVDNCPYSPFGVGCRFSV